MRTLLCLALLVGLCVLMEATDNHKGNLRPLHRLMKRQATAKVRILNRNDQHIPDVSSPPSSGQSAYVYSHPAASRHQGMASDGSTGLRASTDRTSSRGRSPASSSSVTSGAVRPGQTYSYPFGREKTQYVYERPPPRNWTQASDAATGGGERYNRRVGDGRDDQSRERSQAERTRGSGYRSESQRGSTVETRDSARHGAPSALTRREDIVSDKQTLSREEEMQRRLEERALRLRQREEALRRRQELEEQRRRQIEADELKRKEDEEQRRRQIEADELKRKEEDEQRRQQREEEMRRRRVAEEERRRRIEDIEQQRRRRQEEESEGGAGQASEEDRRRQDEERRRRYYEQQQRARQYSTPAPVGGAGSRSQPTTDQRSPQRTDPRSGSNQQPLTGAPPISQGRNYGQNGGAWSTSQQGGSAGYTQQSSPGLTRYSGNYPGSRGQGVYIPTNPSQTYHGGSQTNQQGSQGYPNQRLGSGQYYQPQSNNPRSVSPGRGSYSGFRTRYETNGQVLGEYGAGNEWNLYPAVDQSSSSECPETGLDIRINGLDCPSAVRSYGTYLCYTHEYTSRQCCEVCLPRKQPSRVGCEYGDHTELCSTITPADCYDLRNKHSCCDTCERYRRANAPAGCEYGDMTPRCENVRQNPGLCYIPDNQRLCCDTCNQIKNTSNLSCAWGDYNPSLCQIYDESSSSIRLNCYAPQRRRLCCESCDRLKEWMPKDLPADCQYGDRPVFFNTGQYGRLNCTSLFTIFSIDECRTNSAVAVNCCYTCARLLSGRG